MKRHLHQNNQRITPTSLNRTSTLIERSICDDLVRRLVVSSTSGQRLADGKSAFFPLADCRVDYVSGNRQTGCTFKINAGLGFKNRSTAQTDPDLATFEPVYVPADVSFVTANSDATNPRIDCVFIKPATTDADAATVDVIDPVTKNITSQSLAQTKRWSHSYAVVTGTPAAVPAEPAPPSGFTADDKIASITIAPGSGTFTPSGNLVDRRTLFSADPNLVPAVTSLLASQIVVSPTVNGQANAQDSLADLNARIATVSPRGQIIGRVSWTSTSQVTLARDLGGAIRIEIDGVVWTKSDSDLVFSTASHFVAPETPSANAYVYGYVEIQGGVMVPKLTHTAPNTAAGSKVGYHPTNTTWRHVLTFLLDSGANVLLFDSPEPGEYVWRHTGLVASPGTAGHTTFTAASFNLPPPATARAVLVTANVYAESAELRICAASMIGNNVASYRTPFELSIWGNNGRWSLMASEGGWWIPVSGAGQIGFGYRVSPVWASAYPGGPAVGCELRIMGWRE